MFTKKSEIASSAPKFSKRPSSFFYSGSQQDNSFLIWVTYGSIFVIIFGFFLYSVSKSIKSASKSKNPPSPFDNKLVVGRYKRAHNIWNTFANDPMFVVMARTLMDINTNSAVSAINGLDGNEGNKQIQEAYTNLGRYINENLKFPENVRVTMMYTDGIVFFDSDLQVNDVYFMKNGLPRPVNLYTLGSPLKDHNMLPEVANSLVITDSSDNSLTGYELNDPFYRKIVNDGFGFSERISSSSDRPFTYIAHVIVLEIVPTTGFVKTMTLRIGLPVEPQKV